MEERIVRMYCFKNAFIAICLSFLLFLLPLFVGPNVLWQFYVFYSLLFVYFLTGVYLVKRQHRIGTIIYASLTVVLDIVIVISGSIAILSGERFLNLAHFLMATTPLTLFALLVSVLAYDFHKLENAVVRKQVTSDSNA